ncbi:MAG: DUF1540 domain-containing protein [Clostridiales bacterium]|nr:DUF1540 domain-containing protein [Clostridiales bacterium]
MAIKKMDEPNVGIRCVVDTCEYYMRGDHCAAEKIKVEQKNDDASNGTDCSTFTRKGMF